MAAEPPETIKLIWLDGYFFGDPFVTMWWDARVDERKPFDDFC